MATIYREGDLGLLSGKLAGIGDGSHGHAHALNLRDSGVSAEIGLRDGSSSRAKAEAEGLTVKPVSEAVKGAQLVSILLPDQVQPRVWQDEIEPNLEPDAAVLFAHGFNVNFGRFGPVYGHGDVMTGVNDRGPEIRR